MSRWLTTLHSMRCNIPLVCLQFKDIDGCNIILVFLWFQVQKVLLCLLHGTCLAGWQLSNWYKNFFYGSFSIGTCLAGWQFSNRWFVKFVAIFLLLNVDHPPLEHAWLLDNSPISDLPDTRASSVDYLSLEYVMTGWQLSNWWFVRSKTRHWPTD